MVRMVLTVPDATSARRPLVRWPLVKAWRCARRVPGTAWQLFREPLYNSSQAWSAIVAVIGLYLVMQTASLEERQTMADGWLLFVQAVGIACVIWAIVSALRAPFVTVGKDREKGAWHGNSRIYLRPELVAVVPWTAADADKTIAVEFEDAETDALVYYSIELDPPVLFRASCYMESAPGMLDPTFSAIGFAGRPDSLGTAKADGSGAVRLKGHRAFLRVKLEPETVPVVARVFMRSFELFSDVQSELEVSGGTK